MKTEDPAFNAEKLPFFIEAVKENYTHEVALTMNHYVSGKTWGFHANKTENRKILLFEQSDQSEAKRS